MGQDKRIFVTKLFLLTYFRHSITEDFSVDMTEQPTTLSVGLSEIHPQPKLIKEEVQLNSRKPPIPKKAETKVGRKRGFFMSSW